MKTTDADMQAMLHIDGELPEGEFVADTPSAQAAVADFEYLGELVRTWNETEADVAEEARMAASWQRIASSIGKPKVAPAPPQEKQTPWWRKLLAGPQGFMLGAGVAAAAAVLIYSSTGQTPEPQGIAESTQLGSSHSPVIPAFSKPEVQELDVSKGSGSVYTVIDGDGETAMIWIDDSESDGGDI